MNKFLVILSDINGNPDYLHPSEINGKNKQEIRNLLKEEVPEDHIIEILTVDEYKQLINSKKFKAIINGVFSDTDPGNGNTFLDNMIKNATEYAAALEEESKIQPEEPVNIVKQNCIPSTQISCIQQPTPQSSVKYFIDNGIQFKLEDGQLFKKIWKSVPIEEYMNEEGQKVYPEFRIINKETGKPIKSIKYDVQQLVWTPLKNN